MSVGQLAGLLLIGFCGLGSAVHAAEGASGPPPGTLVTIHLKNQPLSEVLKSLTAQTGMRFQAESGRLQKPSAAPNISIDRDRTPFWDVMADISRISGISPSYCSGGRVTLHDDGGVWARRPAVVRGSFRVSATGSDSLQTIQLGHTPHREAASQISLMIEAEPNLIAVCVEAIKLDVLSDPNGLPIVHPPAPRSGVANNFYRGHVTLRLPIDPGPDVRSIGVLSGTANVLIATGSKTMQARYNPGANEVTEKLGDATVGISCKTTSNGYGVQLVLDYNGDDEIFARRLAKSVDSADVRLLDAQDREYSVGGGGGGAHGRLGVIRTFQFPLHPRGQPAPGPPEKFVCDIPTAFQVVVVPFELKDLSLP